MRSFIKTSVGPVRTGQGHPIQSGPVTEINQNRLAWSCLQDLTGRTIGNLADFFLSLEISVDWPFSCEKQQKAVTHIVISTNKPHFDRLMLPTLDILEDAAVEAIPEPPRTEILPP